jgi:hypothetical protein
VSISTAISSEADEWRQSGYVLARNALSQDEVASLREAVQAESEAFCREQRSRGLSLSDQGHETVRVTNLLERSSGFDDLIDHARVFDTLLTVMGPFLRLLGTEAFVRKGSRGPLLPFHTDGGPSLQQVVLASESVWIQSKVQFFLTDCMEPEDGLLLVIPGSHLRKSGSSNDRCFIPEANEYLERGTHPPGTREIRARAGDAIVFASSLWHAVDRKESSTDRLTVNFRYGQMWCMPYDYRDYGPEVCHRLSPRQRRLVGYLGASTAPRDYYKSPGLFEEENE